MTCKAMDVKTVFRNLVTNCYMSDFDYAETEFSFQTVFHLESVFSYCICVCGLEHEYLDYFTESGTVDEEKYDRVVQFTIDGKCPHVSEGRKEFVKVTKINALHIACAVGTINAIVDSRSLLLTGIHRNLYHLEP